MKDSTPSRARCRSRAAAVSAVVTLFHVTTARRVRSVLSLGLQPGFSQGSRHECWLVTSSRRAWAVQHVRARHRTEAVALVRVAVPRSWLVRRKRGLWTSSRPISPEMIQAVRPSAFIG
jgi:hypothetical protein